jgi:hypothetical protein
MLLSRVPSRRVRDIAIKAGVVEIDSRSYCQGGCGFLKQAKGASTLLRVQILFMTLVAVAVGRAVMGTHGSGSISTSLSGQV